MIDFAPLKQLSVDADKHLGIPSADLISVAIQGCIRALTVAQPGLSHAEIKAQFNPESWGLELLLSKRIVDTVSDKLREIGLDEAQRRSPGKSAGEMLDVCVSNEVTESANAALYLLLAELTASIKSKTRAATDLVFGELGKKCVVARAKQMHGSELLLDHCGVDLLLPGNEQIIGEKYVIGKEFVVFVKAVVERGHKCEIVVSRSHEEVCRWALRKHLPEIDAGHIEIRNLKLLRDYGAIAVLSSKSVDVFTRAKRAKIKIAEELGGMPFLIAEWHPDEEAQVASLLGFPIQDILIKEMSPGSVVAEVAIQKQLWSSLAKFELERRTALCAAVTDFEISIVILDGDEGPGIEVA